MRVVRGIANTWRSASAGVASFVLFALAALRLPRMILPGASTARAILTIGLLLLATIAAVIVYLLVRRREKQKTSKKDGDEEIDNAILMARQALASAQLADVKKPALKTLPVLLVMGPGGSTKTSVILNSGLDAELLAGEVRRGSTVVPTTALALWYARGSILLEAGGKLLQDEKRWAMLTRHLQPTRLAATFSGRTQAPRRVVVCFGCDELLKPGASENVPAAAQKLRARLMEMARDLGVELPVYVLFTKADRLPYFADYVRSFTRDEAQQVLGATLPLDLVEDSGWAARQEHRLGGAFDGIFRSLAALRLQGLARETAPEVRNGVYEFPREFRKISDLAIRFLVELTRPSPLNVEPVLRGFYFTGVRPVQISDPGAAPAAASFGAGPSPDATMVLSTRDLAASAAAQTPGTRKIPEWVFLRRLFGDVLFADRTAMELTGGSTRVNVLRRSLLTAAAVVLTVITAGFALSWAENRGLTRRAEAAVAATSSVTGTTGIAPLEDLRRLDSLRTVADSLHRWSDGPPIGLRWGLYVGDDLLPPLRALWFERFRELLWPRTRAHLLATLGQPPATLSDPAEYRRLFDALKAHLLSSTEYQRADSVEPTFLATELARHWWAAEPVDVERDSIARAQFAFFSRQLARRDEPFDPPSPAIGPMRQALARFQGLEPQYDAFLAMAAEGRQPESFSERPVLGGPPVNAAYTAEGWARVNANLGRLRESVEGDDWVLGPAAVRAGQPWDSVQDTLLKLYRADYVQSWLAFLGQSRVERFPTGQARSAYTTLSGGAGGSGSPLMGLLELVSRHVAVDSQLVGRHFEAVHRVVPPGDAGDDGTAAAAYLGALRELADEFGRADDPELPNRLRDAAGNVERQIRALQLGPSEAARHVARLLAQPAELATGLAGDIPKAQLNQELTRFCNQFQRLAAGFPFASSSRDATLNDLDDLLLPGGGVVSRVTEGPLGEVVEEIGRGFQRTGSEVSIAFVNSLNRAAAVRGLLYDPSGGYRTIYVTLQPRFPSDGSISAVDVQIGGESYRFTPENPSRYEFQWRADQNQPARLVVHRAAGGPIEILGSGRWGLVKLLARADWPRNSTQLSWPLDGAGTLSAGISVQPEEPRMDSLTLSCNR